MSIYNMVFMFSVFIYIPILYMLFESFFNEKYHNKNYIPLSYVAYCACMLIIFMVADKFWLYFIYNIFAVFFISYNYVSKIKKRILNVGIIVSILLISQFVVYLILKIGDFNPFQVKDYNATFDLILLRLITLIITYIIYENKKSQKSDYPSPNHYYVIQSLILVGILLLFINLMDNENLSLKKMLFSSLVMLLVVGMIIYVDRKNKNIYKTISYYSEINLLKQQNEAYEQEMKVINAYMSKIKLVKHDMKNHILSLNSLYQEHENDVAQQYSQHLLKEIEMNENVANSGNFIIDSIINYKLQDINSLDVDIKLNLNIAENISIFPFDLTVVLANLFDNAIEAIKKCKSKKTLTISLACNKNNLIILMDNSFEEKIVQANGKLLSTKKSKVNHGMGIVNVERVLEKYAGSMNFEYNEKTFSVSVIIPYN